MQAPLTLADALEALVGPQAMQSLVQPDDVATRFVLLVDRLGHAHASPGLWPWVAPTGSFLTDVQGGHTVIGIDNEFRYAPYVQLLESVDLKRAIELYAAFYPQLQAACAQRSAAGAPFHARLMSLLDQLLQAPEISERSHVHRADPVGKSDAGQAVTHYLFDDPALEAATAGQKLMVRMGALNERRVKLRLAELRSLLRPLGDPP